MRILLQVWCHCPVKLGRCGLGRALDSACLSLNLSEWVVGKRVGVCSWLRGVWGKCVREGCIEAQGGVRSRYGVCDSRLCDGETSSGVGGLWRVVLVALGWKMRGG